MAVKTGKINEFINWLVKKYPTEYKTSYSGLTLDKANDAKLLTSKSACQTCELTVEFNKICSDDKFVEFAHVFITESNYKPTYDDLMDMFGETNLFKELQGLSKEAVIEMCYSFGVQHGSPMRIIQMALLKDFSSCTDAQITDDSNSTCSAKMSEFPAQNGGNTSQKVTMTTTANSISMSEFMDRAYTARGIYLKALNIDGWKGIVENRYAKERMAIRKTLKI